MFPSLYLSFMGATCSRYTFTWKLWPSPEYFAAICRAFSAAEEAVVQEKGVGLGDAIASVKITGKDCVA